MPGFLRPFDGLSPQGEKILVVVQLSGGNDGLNTLVPFRNDIYYKSRPNLAIHSSKVLRLNDEQGFNSILPEMADLYNRGMMTIVNNVGYDNPARSHFRAMDIWHSASGANQTLDTGWIGRYLDSSCLGCERAAQALFMDSAQILALKGKNRVGFSAGEIHKLNEAANTPRFQQLLKAKHAADHQELDFMYKTLASAVSTAGYLTETAGKFKSRSMYPTGYLSQQLKSTTELIAGGCYSRIYYTNLTGFDTHTNQLADQSIQLTQLSKALGVFIKDMEQIGRLDDVLVMVFSEFGRRVKENGSGTDHGTANQLYLIGKHLPKAGMFNAAPDLQKLDDVGDLIHTVDFRQVYIEVVEKWLQVNSSQIIAGSFPRLSLL